MVNSFELSVFEIVGSPMCVASGDGQKVYDRLSAVLKEGKSVTLSFRNVSALTSAFLNSAVGQLYGVFTDEQIRSLLAVEGMEQDDLALLARVVATAKIYFSDPIRFKRNLHEVLGDDDE